MREPREGDSITPSLRLVRPLGAGGMGRVWIARHSGLHTDVVVKLIAENLAKNPEAIARFSREAAAASQVRSPHVVQIFDHGLTQDGQPYIAMELLEGESLRERLDRERVLPPRDVVTIVAHCAKALARAHERGVVHRDIKPDNIFLGDSGSGDIFAKVLDFGIAKATGGSFIATTTGSVLGSPYYMSPEQVLGSKSVDHRSDLWSLGVVVSEALTGQRPFEAETIGALSIAICHGALPAPRTVQPNLPAGIDAWFARACARDMNARFGSAKELADALASALAGSPAQISHVAQPALAATVPLTTTAGFASAHQAPPRPGWHAWALAGGIVLLGAIGGIVAWSMRSGPAAQVDEPATQPSKPEHRPAKSIAPPPEEPIELPTVVASGTAPAAGSTIKAGKSAASPKPSAAQPSASIASPPPLPPAVTPVPKVTHDPNIF